MLADEANQNENDISDLLKSIEAWSTDFECCWAPIFVGKLKSTLIYDTVGISMLFSAIDSLQQRFVPSELRPSVLRLCH